jgi:hypothetical protein
MPKILGKNFPCEADDIDDDKSNIIFVPADDLLVLGMLIEVMHTSRISYVFRRKEAMVSLLRPVLLCWRSVIIID